MARLLDIQRHVGVAVRPCARYHAMMSQVTPDRWAKRARTWDKLCSSTIFESIKAIGTAVLPQGLMIDTAEADAELQRLP